MDTPYHWFVTNAFGWEADDRLHVAINRLLKRTPKDDKYAVWRVPGKNKGTHYAINFYSPQVKDALFCGLVPVKAGHIICDGRVVPENEDA